MLKLLIKTLAIQHMRNMVQITDGKLFLRFKKAGISKALSVVNIGPEGEEQIQRFAVVRDNPDDIENGKWALVCKSSADTVSWADETPDGRHTQVLERFENWVDANDALEIIVRAVTNRAKSFDTPISFWLFIVSHALVATFLGAIAWRLNSMIL